MRKNAILLLVLLVFSITKLNAQSFRFGLKGGINFSQLKTDAGSFKDIYEQSTATKTGYVGGVFFRFGDKVFIQPELLFSAKGGKINALQTPGSPPAQTLDIDYSSIDVPVLLGFKVGPIRLNAGPVASFKVSQNIDDDLKKYSSNVAESFKNAAYGYQAGVGIDIGAFSVDLRYEGSISEVSAISDLTKNVMASQKGKLFQLTAGLRLF